MGYAPVQCFKELRPGEEGIFLAATWLAINVEVVDQLWEPLSSLETKDKFVYLSISQ